jgi:hypothetical protein
MLAVGRRLVKLELKAVLVVRRSGKGNSEGGK